MYVCVYVSVFVSVCLFVCLFFSSFVGLFVWFGLVIGLVSFVYWFGLFICLDCLLVAWFCCCFCCSCYCWWCFFFRFHMSGDIWRHLSHGPGSSGYLQLHVESEEFNFSMSPGWSVGLQFFASKITDTMNVLARGVGEKFVTMKHNHCSCYRLLRFWEWSPFKPATIRHIFGYYIWSWDVVWLLLHQLTELVVELPKDLSLKPTTHSSVEIDGNGGFPTISNYVVKIWNHHPIDSQPCVSMDGYQLPGGSLQMIVF